MLQIIIGLVFGLFLFGVTIQSYILGLKHGKLLINHIIPTFIPTPIEAVKSTINTIDTIESTIHEYKQYKTEKDGNKILEDGWANILNYTGEPQKEVGDS